MRRSLLLLNCSRDNKSLLTGASQMVFVLIFSNTAWLGVLGIDLDSAWVLWGVLSFIIRVTDLVHYCGLI